MELAVVLLAVFDEGYGVLAGEKTCFERLKVVAVIGLDGVPVALYVIDDALLRRRIGDSAEFRLFCGE